MATHTNTAPGHCPEATGRTRREALTALGFTGLGGIAVAGFARPEGVLRHDGAKPFGVSLHIEAKSDATLLAACAAFDAAHRAVEQDNATGGSDGETERLGREWYLALNAVTDAPRPETPAGRVALARAARIALIDQVATTIGETYDDQATAEERLVMAALDSMAEQRA